MRSSLRLVAAGPARQGVLSLPFLLMSNLYQVRLQYAVHVSATSKREAFDKVCRALRDNPGSHIAKVDQADTPKGNPSLMKRIIKGV